MGTFATIANGHPSTVFETAANGYDNPKGKLRGPDWQKRIAG